MTTYEEPEQVDISDLDKAELFRRLFNYAKPQGMGYLHYKNRDMNKEEAEQIIANLLSTFGKGYNAKYALSFDYFEGRLMKVNLTKDTMNPHSYDFDNGGPGTVQSIVNKMKLDLEKENA